MGCGSSSATDNVAASNEVKKLNNDIAKKVSMAAKQDRETVKLMLLGSGECGKSTILKQMKIINLGKFTPEEEAEGRELVFKNTLDALQTLIGACKDLGIDFTVPETADKAAKLMEVDTSEPIEISLSEDITAVWNDGGIQAAKKRENEFHLIDSASYFLSKVPEYFQESFVPSLQDVLRTRLTTTGIVMTSFILEGKEFKMFDVGGQRGERKKWIHCFDNVTAVFFIGSLSEFDQVLAEDRTKNRLLESLDLFEDVVNLKCFEEAPVILFLNKSDLYEQKMEAGKNLGDFLDDYTGPAGDYDAGIDFIKEEYKKCIYDEEKDFYTHVTNATNTENVRTVWVMTRDIIINSKMEGAGFG